VFAGGCISGRAGEMGRRQECSPTKRGKGTLRRWEGIGRGSRTGSREEDQGTARTFRKGERRNNGGLTRNYVCPRRAKRERRREGE
jgi:hypothetical protein